MVPPWLHILSIVYLALGGLCAGVIGADVLRRPQRMWIMNVVWPVTAFFGTVVVVWAYFRYGVLASKRAVMEAKERGMEPASAMAPFAVMVGTGSLHCGSGCTCGDLCAEWLVFAAPVIATWFGWHSIFHEKMFAVWIVDYIFAWVFGVAFQYFTIVPMRGLSPGKGVVAAMKADTLSLTAWQVGMYGFMAIANLWIFRRVLDVKLETNSFEFWFMMQIAMICGFATAYPVNWWLIRAGVKEKM